MTVVLIYRKRRAGVHSLEELFGALGKHLRTEVGVVEYEMGPRRRLPLDILQLRRLRADVYHVTGDVTYVAAMLPWAKTVVTVPDIGHYLHGLTGIKRAVYRLLWLTLPIRLARGIVAISRETQDQIVEYLGVERGRVEVVDCCYGPHFHAVQREFSTERPVILQVGTRAYKNVPRLVQALKGINCRLVLVGPVDDALEQLLDECGTEYESHVNLSSEELFQKYVNCDIVSFVSIGEGFGVPIIEAQAAGRPVITANVSPMKEVAGDGACLVDPLDVAAIRQGIQRIISDATYRRTLVENGATNAARYSSAAIGERYLALYRRIA